MVAVPVRVENQFRPLAAKLGKGGDDLVGKGCKLIVDDQRAVCADGHADVAACTFQHMHAAGDVGRFHFDARETIRRTGPGLVERGAAKQNSRQAEPYFHEGSSEVDVCSGFGVVGPLRRCVLLMAFHDPIKEAVA